MQAARRNRTSIKEQETKRATSDAQSTGHSRFRRAGGTRRAL
jgi:hypothetical protein